MRGFCDMRKLLLAVAAVCALALPAAAATVTIKITKTGFAPTTVSIATGDSVSFSNTDTAAHQVVFKSTTGVQCAQPLVVQAGASASCTFTRAGKYGFSDPTHKGKGFKGIVNVTQGAAVTLAASSHVLTYGGKTTLSGSISSGQPNQKVTVHAQACGQASFSPLATLTTTAGGAYSYAAQPSLITSYEVRLKNATSSPLTVKVRPRIRLRKLAPRRFRATVTAAQSFAGRTASFQRYSATLGRWVQVRLFALRAAGTTTLPISPTAVSRRTFRARVRSGLRVRVLLPKTQVGACYAAGVSNVIRS
jgi:plastocyanin